MRMFSSFEGRQDRRLARAGALLLSIAAVAGGIVLAHGQQTGGPTPSGRGAEVYFVDLKDGATIPSKTTIYFGLRNMGVAPAGSDRENSGHHHLLIDTDLPPLNRPIPADFNHLHFGAGQTEAEITLKPGEHTLQLLMGDKDHVPHSPPVMSPRIRVRVAGTPAPPVVTGGPTPSGPGAEVYFFDLKDGAVIPPKTTIYFGLRNMGVAPAGSDRENAGHHHLLIDTDLPPLDQPIPSDFNHLHFGAGQTEAEITLKHGEHTLQLADGRQGPHSAHAAGDVAAHQGAGRRPVAAQARAGRRAGLFRRPAGLVGAAAEGDHPFRAHQYGRGAGRHREGQYRPSSSLDRHQSAAARRADPE